MNEEDQAYTLMIMVAEKLCSDGEYEQALHILTGAIAAVPELPFAYSALGWTLGKLKRYEDAKDKLRQGLSICEVLKADSSLYRTQVSWIYSRLGWIFLEQKNYPSAEESFRQAIGLDASETHAVKVAATDELALVRLGQLLEKQGRRNEAKEAYQRAMKLCPNNRLARKYLRNIKSPIGMIFWG